jgi:hypothetical protein
MTLKAEIVNEKQTFSYFFGFFTFLTHCHFYLRLALKAVGIL